MVRVSRCKDVGQNIPGVVLDKNKNTDEEGGDVVKPSKNATKAFFGLT